MHTLHIATDQIILVAYVLYILLNVFELFVVLNKVIDVAVDVVTKVRGVIVL